MHNRITLSLCIMIGLQGCSSKPGTGTDNDGANGIDFRSNEPARRIATDILNGMDFRMENSPIPNRQRLIAMEEEELSFCAGNVSDKTITAYIETTLTGSQLGELQTFGAKVYCVNDMGAISLLSHKDVSLPPNDTRQITWDDVDPSKARAVPVPVAMQDSTQPQTSDNKQAEKSPSQFQSIPEVIEGIDGNLPENQCLSRFYAYTDSKDQSGFSVEIQPTAVDIRMSDFYAISGRKEVRKDGSILVYESGEPPTYIRCKGNRIQIRFNDGTKTYSVNSSKGNIWSEAERLGWPISEESLKGIVKRVRDRHFSKG